MVGSALLELLNIMLNNIGGVGGGKILKFMSFIKFKGKIKCERAVGTQGLNLHDNYRALGSVKMFLISSKSINLKEWGPLGSLLMRLICM